MAENSKIAWTTHTFNPWMGCSKVSQGCVHCYAENLMYTRYGKVTWGPNGTRVRTAPANWSKPFAWDKAAKAAGECHRVFCASLADICEEWSGPIHVAGKSEDGKPELHYLWHGPTKSVTHGPNYLGPDRCVTSGQMLMNPFHKFQPLPGYRHATMDDVRAELWEIVEHTPNLDWLILTKRADRTHLVPTLPNIWMGVSIEDAENDYRWRNHLQHETRFAVRWISAEPLLGRLPIETWESVPDWIIFGGESDQGQPARQCAIEWIRDGISECRNRGIVPFVKQLGSQPIDEIDGSGIILKDKAGADPSEWPEDLRIRQFPQLATAQ